MASTASDLIETGSAQDVIGFAVDRFHPRLTLACSFQKEESVLVHMLTEVEPAAHVFMIDTGVLFPETLQTWQAFEDRFGVRIEVIDARSEDGPWTAERCCGQAKVDALERALADVDAWITGIRREQAPTRAGAPKLEQDPKRGIWKVNPLAEWSEKDVWDYIFRNDLPYHPLHDRGYSSIGCAPCTQPGEGRAGRWAGQNKTECGIHE
jgi:phosphoadenosine phosphosulfate reductase